MDLEFEEEYLLIEDGVDTMLVEHLEDEEIEDVDDRIQVEIDQNDVDDDGGDIEMEALEEPEQPSKSRKILIDETFSCDKCSKRDLNRKQLQFHMVAEHSGHNGPFECPICTRMYATRTKLNRHYYRHKDDVKPLCTR